MPGLKLGHYSIRTGHLEASRRFYTEAIGLRVGYRPAFDFPGVWLYLDEDESEFGVVHIIGVDSDSADALKAHLGERDGDQLTGSGAVDHMAFLATGPDEAKARFDRLRIPYEERAVPSMALTQIFVVDPSGVTIELNYRTS